MDQKISSIPENDVENPVKNDFDPGTHVVDIVFNNEIVNQWTTMPLEEREKFERKLIWKLDLRLIPWLSLLYLLSFLDRTNIGNAKIQGVIIHSEENHSRHSWSKIYISLGRNSICA